MRRLLSVIICAASAAAGEEPSSLKSIHVHDVRESMGPIENETPPVIQSGRDAVDWMLRAPTALTPWRLAAILPDDAFQMLPDTEGRPVGGEPWSTGLEGILGGSLQSLGDLISSAKWSVVQPAEPDPEPRAGKAALLQARMSIPISEELPIEARLGIETDSVQEDYFVFSTELGSAHNPLGARWLAWSTRIDYRTSLESPASAKAEQRVGLRLTKNDQLGVSGRLEERNLDAVSSPLSELAPAGEAYWSHQWLAGLDSSLKVRQALPDLQSIWLTGAGGDVQLEAALRASLSGTTRLDLQGTTTPDLTQYGVRLQLEFLLGAPVPVTPERLMLSVPPD